MHHKLIKYDLLSHIFLAVSLVLIVASFFFKSLGQFQYLIIFLAVAIYLSSSVIHHYLDKSLTLEVGLEYILIGALAILLIFGLAL